MRSIWSSYRGLFRSRDFEQWRTMQDFMATQQITITSLKKLGEVNSDTIDHATSPELQDSTNAPRDLAPVNPIKKGKTRHDSDSGYESDGDAKEVANVFQLHRRARAHYLKHISQNYWLRDLGPLPPARKVKTEQPRDNDGPIEAKEDDDFEPFNSPEDILFEEEVKRYFDDPNCPEALERRRAERNVDHFTKVWRQLDSLNANVKLSVEDDVPNSAHLEIDLTDDCFVSFAEIDDSGHVLGFTIPDDSDSDSETGPESESDDESKSESSLDDKHDSLFDEDNERNVICKPSDNDDVFTELSCPRPSTPLSGSTTEAENVSHLDLWTFEEETRPSSTKNAKDIKDLIEDRNRALALHVEQNPGWEYVNFKGSGRNRTILRLPKQQDCLQCVAKNLPCSRSPPSCSRCNRSEGGVCLVQRYLDASERNKLGLLDWKVVLVKMPDDTDEIWAAKKRMESAILDRFEAEMEKGNWVVPVNSKNIGYYILRSARILRVGSEVELDLRRSDGVVREMACGRAGRSQKLEMSLRVPASVLFENGS